MSATATPLHRDAPGVPAVLESTPPSKWAGAVERARKIVRDNVVEQNLPGASIAVGLGGALVWAEGFGWADLERRVPVAPGTRFRIGTASNALTSAAAGLLLQEGRLQLDERIQAYVPEFPEKKWPVTLRQLMGHTAGIPNDGGDEGPLFSRHCERADEALPAFQESDLLFEPGTRYRPSSYGWILVSAAIEAAARAPLAAFLGKQVFEPLGMDHTGADAGIDPGPGRATSYFPRFAADPRYGPQLMRDVDYSCYAGSSVFVSTPTDLVRFAQALDHGRLLKPETVRLLQSSQRLASGQLTGYGLGWDLETTALLGKQTAVIGHDGSLLGGMAVSFMTFTDYGMVVAVASNTSYADTFSMGVKVAEAFLSPR